MKKLFFATLIVLFTFSLVGAEGTCTWTKAKCKEYHEGCYIITAACTSDESAGTVSSTMSDDVYPTLIGMFCTEAYVVPGSTAPTDGFDVYLKSDAGLDCYSSTDCDETNNTDLDRTKYRPLTGAWVITAANCGNSKLFNVIMKFQ